jgi:hypothetical protein
MHEFARATHRLHSTPVSSFVVMGDAKRRVFYYGHLGAGWLQGGHIHEDVFAR